MCSRGSGLDARCPTSPGFLSFYAQYPTLACCHQREHFCAPQVILGSKSPFPLGPQKSLAKSPCRYSQASAKGGRGVPQHTGRHSWFSVQVVHMAGLELRALLEESEASVSPLLCLSQNGPPSFLQPVTVQLPLPPGITGEACLLHDQSWVLRGGSCI